MTTMVRDFQRQRVYDAEHALSVMLDRQFLAPTVQIHGSTVVLPTERRFADVEAVQRYVDAVLALNWVQARWKRASIPVRVRARRTDHAAHYERVGAVMAIPVSTGGSDFSWATREMVVLHELAHHLAPSDDGHGPKFTDTFVELIEGVLGDEAAFLLRSLFLDEGVRLR